MPAYNTKAPVGMYPGDTETLFNAESTASITKSQQVYLTNDVGTGDVECVVAGSFSGAPGTFEVDIQFAPTDTDALYVSPATGGAISTVNAANAFNFKYDPAPGNFVRAFMKTPGNAVNLTLTVTR